EFLMIYHCSFGDLDTAASIARTLVSRAASSSHSAASRTYLNASRAFMYAGLLSEGVTATELSYKSGIEAGLVRIPQQAAIGLASRHVSLGHDESAHLWLARADALAHVNATGSWYGGLAPLHIEFSLYRDSVDEAYSIYNR